MDKFRHWCYYLPGFLVNANDICHPVDSVLKNAGDMSQQAKTPCASRLAEAASFDRGFITAARIMKANAAPTAIKVRPPISAMMSIWSLIWSSIELRFRPISITPRISFSAP
jgi:hypothetical protein